MQICKLTIRILSIFSVLSVPLWLICMLSVEEALQLVEEHARPLAPRRVALERGGGAGAGRGHHERRQFAAVRQGADGWLRRRQQRPRAEAAKCWKKSAPAPCRGARHARHGVANHDRCAASRRRRRRRPVRTDRARSTIARCGSCKSIRSPASTCCRWARRCESATRVFERGVTLRPIEIGILAEIGHAVVPRASAAARRRPADRQRTGRRRREARPPARFATATARCSRPPIARDGGAAIELPVARDDPRRAASD